VFGWIKSSAGLAKVKLRGRDQVDATRGRGLGKYEAAFHENDIDETVRTTSVGVDHPVDTPCLGFGPSCQSKQYPRRRRASLAEPSDVADYYGSFFKIVWGCVSEIIKVSFACSCHVSWPAVGRIPLK
jgi:hypothetical protein